MKKLLMAAALLACASPAFAETKWSEFNRDNGFIYSLNVKGVKMLGPTNRDARVWAKKAPIKPKGAESDVTLLSVNCVTRQFRLVQNIQYDVAGNADTTDGDNSWDYVAPESMIEFIADVICMDPATVG